MHYLPWILLTTAFAAAKPSVFEDKLPLPSRPLQWGEINFLHTTDIHGWLLGHRHTTWPEPHYSADLGDFRSFVQHMRDKADEQGVDLLLIDSGDHHDGGGIVSVSPESADMSDYYISTLNYDALAIGNHELYKSIDAQYVHRSVERNIWNGRYLTSNVNITQADGTSVPLGNRMAKFRTKQGKKVTAFGVIYNFKANAENTVVQSPLEMIKEEWFLEAIEERPDFLQVLIPGHMSVRDFTSDWEEVMHAIRLKHPKTPVFIFGGHNHIRDCKKPDAHSIIMASGRYMETVGWVSANLTNVGKMKLSRRYLDNNRKTFKYHTGTLQGESFDTDTGLALSNELHETHRNLNLSVVLGHSPKNYFLSRYPATSDHSVLKKLMDDVLPGTVFNEEADADHFRLFVANSGSQRFDVFKGPFTVDDQFVTSPFVSRFVHFNVTARVGRQLVWKMNDEGATQFLPSDDTQRSYLSWVEDQSLRHYRTAERAQAAFNAEKDTDKSQYGYVTVDSCGDRGDDIDHLPFPSRGKIPDYVGSTFPLDKPDDETITVVVMDFFLNDVVNAVNKLDPSVELDYSSFKPYGDPKVQIKDVWGIYAKKFW